jgi:hypothetical protein
MSRRIVALRRRRKPVQAAGPHGAARSGAGARRLPRRGPRASTRSPSRRHRRRRSELRPVGRGRQDRQARLCRSSARSPFQPEPPRARGVVRSSGSAATVRNAKFTVSEPVARHQGQLTPSTRGRGAPSPAAGSATARVASGPSCSSASTVPAGSVATVLSVAPATADAAAGVRAAVGHEWWVPGRDLALRGVGPPLVNAASRPLGVSLAAWGGDRADSWTTPRPPSSRWRPAPRSTITFDAALEESG